MWKYDVLSFMIDLQHFWLHWISGQVVERFCGVCKKLAIFYEYYEFRIAVLLLRTSFIKPKGKYRKYCEMKQTYRELLSA